MEDLLSAANAEHAEQVQVKNDALREADEKLQEMAARVQSARVEHAEQCDRHVAEVSGMVEKKRAERAELVAAFEEEKSQLQEVAGLVAASLQEKAAHGCSRPIRSPSPPQPCTLHPAPCTLNPEPYTLNPQL